MKKPGFIDRHWVKDIYLPVRNAFLPELESLNTNTRNRIVAYTHYKMQVYRYAFYVSILGFFAFNLTMIFSGRILFAIPVMTMAVASNITYIVKDMYKGKRDKFVKSFLEIYIQQFFDYAETNKYDTSYFFPIHADNFRFALKNHLVQENYYLTDGEVFSFMIYFCRINFSKPESYRPQFHIGI